MRTNLFVFVAALVAVTTLPAKAQTVVAIDPQTIVSNEVLCDGSDELQVCTGACLDEAGQPTDGTCVLTDARTSTGVLWDCNVTHPGGVSLSCVTKEVVKAACLGLGSDWRWSERRNRCWRHREEERAPPSPPPPPLPPPTYTGDGGMTTFSSGVAVAIPPCHPCPDCNCPAPLPPPPGGRCTGGELTRISDGLSAIENRVERGETTILAVEEVNELRAEAENLREQANGCHDEVLAERATILVAALESPPPPPPTDYLPEFERVHQHLDDLALGSAEEEDENWCTDTGAGVFTCIVLPILVGGTVIGVATALIYDYYDDDSANQVRTFY